MLYESTFLYHAYYESYDLIGHCEVRVFVHALCIVASGQLLCIYITHAKRHTYVVCVWSTHAVSGTSEPAGQRVQLSRRVMAHVYMPSALISAWHKLLIPCCVGIHVYGNA